MKVAGTKKNGTSKNVRDVFSRSFQNQLNKLYPRDRVLVKKFVKELIAKGRSSSRIKRYLFTICGQARYFSKPYTSLTEDDIISWLEVLHSSNYKPWTIYTIMTQMRFFLRWLGKEELTELIKPKTPKNERLPEEILTPQDILKLAKAATTARDRALVEVLYESGVRIGELLNIRLKHIVFDYYGARIRVAGKTGSRIVRITHSVKALTEWLEEHPDRENPEAYLWCRLSASRDPKYAEKHIVHRTVSKILKRLAKEAGVKKKVNPHAFRHARATYLAKYLTEAQLKVFFGWSPTSDMPAVYIHMSGRDVDKAVIKADGIKIDNENAENNPLKLKSCPRCKEDNDPANHFCSRCGMPLSDIFPVVESTDQGELLKVLATAKNLFKEIENIKLMIKMLNIDTNSTIASKNILQTKLNLM